MDIYDVAVVGGGPAGAMAAIRAGQLKQRVVLVERNDGIGRKLLLTGKGRCNLTNTAPMDVFIDKFAGPGQFLRSAFFAFSNEDLSGFCEANGLQLKAERQGRVFPSNDRAASVVAMLSNALAKNKVEVRYCSRVIGLIRQKEYFELAVAGQSSICARKVILATGGVSFRQTGSTGDGYHLAARMGHRIVALKPALVPLRAKEAWVKQLQGLSLENVRLSFVCGKKKIVSTVGECIFTHFGVSGPLVLDLSGEVVARLKKDGPTHLLIDLKPGLTREQLEMRLLREFKNSGKMQLDNLMKNLLPQRLVSIFISLLSLDGKRKASQITHDERRSMINLLKGLPLTIVGSLPIEEAMITSGGMATEEINPRTMESKIVPGLYFAGEMINGSAPSGGYNLQKAFSTGYLAGEQVSQCVK